MVDGIILIRTRCEFQRASATRRVARK